MCELWIHRTHSTIDHADLSIVRTLRVNGKLVGSGMFHYLSVSDTLLIAWTCDLKLSDKSDRLNIIRCVLVPQEDLAGPSQWRIVTTGTIVVSGRTQFDDCHNYFKVNNYLKI